MFQELPLAAGYPGSHFCCSRPLSQSTVSGLTGFEGHEDLGEQLAKAAKID